MTDIPPAETNDPVPVERPDDASSRQESQWADLVDKIRKDDPAGMEELYRVFSRGIRFFFFRQLGSQDVDDKVHEAFLIVAQAIRKGDLREPERLMGYVRTVVRRQVAAQIEQVSQQRRQHVDMDHTLTISDGTKSPEQEVIDRQHQDIARRVLKGVGRRDREILIRFYLNEQTPEQICRDMGLTETQFRLLKSRAKARFGELGKRHMAMQRLHFS